MFNQVTVGENLNKKDLRDNYQAGIAKLEDIKANASSMSQAQALGALADLANIQLKTLKALKDLLG